MSGGVAVTSSARVRIKGHAASGRWQQVPLFICKRPCAPFNSALARHLTIPIPCSLTLCSHPFLPDLQFLHASMGGHHIRAGVLLKVGLSLICAFSTLHQPGLVLVDGICSQVVWTSDPVGAVPGVLLAIHTCPFPPGSGDSAGFALSYLPPHP
jgi:hypothetical protein